ncbi:hypothetical protein CWB99_01370 [Pseudoalteromonas rubra]|uniref:DUF4231 domain-containing protein n=1 Tax=Pseudoalteromonas rubra TaxID=43658 RepID=A0A5S3WV16_9GAMM|nr:DUF4231 domain-containing protein [Pseudoalteromonas rubra]TMP28109.1 hypothetical protein CWC00_22095 [Pseudoalteromonas rubra]TMP32773.1 hypothetical protein CWB99_01370 [Pseudoalteromonas rubra]
MKDNTMALTMEQNTYISERLEHQISWYDTKSMDNQRAYHRCQIVELCSAVSIPFITGLWGSVVAGQVIIGILGVLIAVCAGLSNLKKYQQNWLNYRTSCEMLRRERFLYLTACAPYHEADKFNLLVTRVEDILAKEHGEWRVNVQPRQTTHGETGQPG